MAVLNNTGIRMGASGAGGAAAGGIGDGDYGSTRFNSDDSTYLNKTPSGAGNRKTWTWSGWVKRSNLSAAYPTLFCAGSAGVSEGSIRFISADTIEFYDYNSGYNAQVFTTAVFRDTSAWYHIVAVFDTTNGTAAQRLRIYINGVEDAGTGRVNPTQNLDGYVNNTIAHSIGSFYSTGRHFDGYLADVHFVDGLALDATSFGEEDGTTGQWVPKEYTGSYGTNGFHLAMDPSESNPFGDDSSGNGNDWTANNLSTTAGAGNDLLADVPGAPYDNGLDGGGNYATLNPLHTGASTLSNGNLDASGTGALPTIIPGSGQWYYEIDGTGYDWDGTVDNFTSAAGSYNFGQRPFEGTVTTDYKALNTFNLDAPLIDDPSEYFDVRSGLSAPFTVSDINFEADLIVGKSTSNSEYWIWADAVRGFDKPLKSNTTTAEGSGDAYTSVGSSGYSSDNNWFSSGRTYTTWAWDAGSEDAETNDDGSIDSEVKANPTAGFSIVKYTSASGTGSISATIGHGLNADIGFMIIKNRDWASSSQGWPVWHQSSPTATRYLDATGDFSNSEYTSFFNANPTDSVFSVRCNGSVSTGNRYRSYGNSYNYIAYLWSEVEGYSKFGSWDGNNSPDGTFVYTNFRPAFLLWKRSNGTTNWYIYDSSRSTVNVVNDNLETNTADPENTLTSMNVDFTSNGFKMRGSDGDINGSGGTYVYAAFAETPFKYSNAR